MNKEKIIAMAREAGIGVTDESLIPVWHLGIDYLERFAALIAAAERERCAQLCDSADKSTHPADLADAIRARSNT